MNWKTVPTTADVTTGDRGVWAVGETDDAVAGSRPLVQRLDDDAFVNVAVPASAGSIFTSLGRLATLSTGET